jgi:hypothetical protein
MKININELENEIIYKNSSNSSNSSNYIIGNIIMICNYNSNMHILSYHHLTQLDSRYANILILLSMFTGIIEIINFNAHISDSIYLFIGISNIILGVLFNRYNELKLNISAQSHYEFHNNFEKIKMKVDMNNNIKNSSAFLFKNIDSFIKHTNNEIELLYTTRPTIPSKILTEYQINKTKIQLQNNNKVFFNKKKSKVFDINKSFNFCEIHTIPEEDKREYNEFMENIRQKNLDKIKERNNNLIHFK